MIPTVSSHACPGRANGSPGQRSGSLGLDHPKLYKLLLCLTSSDPCPSGLLLPIHTGGLWSVWVAWPLPQPFAPSLLPVRIQVCLGSPALGTEHWGLLKAKGWSGGEVGGLAASSLALVPCLGGAQLAKAAHLPLGHRLSLQLIRIPGRELQPGLCHLAQVTQVTRCEKALSFIYRCAGCRGASLSSSCPGSGPSGACLQA